MAAATRYKPDKGWKRFRSALDTTRFKGTVRKHLRRATELNGKLAEREVRQMIRKNAGGFDANAKLTREIKGSSTPLVGKGEFNLFQAITSEVQDDVTVFVGVLATIEEFNIAKALHEGVVIPVTPKMRFMFQSLYWVSIGNWEPSQLTGAAVDMWKMKPGGWFPLKKSTTRILIPKRPFIEKGFESKKLRAGAKKNWEDAVVRALRDTAKKK